MFNRQSITAGEDGLENHINRWTTNAIRGISINSDKKVSVLILIILKRLYDDQSD